MTEPPPLDDPDSTPPASPDLLLRPGPGQSREAWLDALGRDLVARFEIAVGGTRLRVHEVELYLWSEDHPDPFAHRHPLQRTAGRWVFHRQGTSYRGGSFKGLDLSFGPADVYGGALIRSVREPSGRWICGPSLVVDHLLRLTGSRSVAELDAALGPAGVERTSPMRGTLLPAGPGPAALSTARVGLTLNRVAQHPEMPRFIGRRLRFLVEPRRISKGRPQAVIALHQDGHDDHAIAAALGTQRSAIHRYLDAYREGWERGPPERVRAPLEICRVLGAVARMNRTGALAGAPDPEGPSRGP